MPIPQTPRWRVVLPVLSRACCSFPVACTEPLAARRCWVRPALSEEFAFSSYLRKGPLRSLRGFSRMVPSADRPDRLLCAAFALSSTATRASPLRVRGGITRDGALSTGRSAELVGRWVSGGRWWGRAVHTPACAVPPSPRGVVAGRVGLEGRRWAPGPTRLPVSPVPSVACASLPRASTSQPLLRRGRVACGVCRVLSGECGCRLVPPSHGSVPTAGGDRGSRTTPPSPSAGLSRVRDPRGWPRSRGRTLLGGTGGRPRPARRRT